MPSINRIRVNNVKYNFGTQGYDDFVMRLNGKNTIYDLANGGGKSVLMLLLLQNMLPNSTLDEKQPIEKLFREGNDNTVIHSLIEWKLEPHYVKNGYRFLTTGFCARKAREEEGEETVRASASVEYYNYCIFYREPNDNDVVNLPLEQEGRRVTYRGLRNYLRELGRRDHSLEVRVFQGRGEYQRFLRDYGIHESAWELVRGINRTEGHVRTFFETNYKTTRKVVEDLFIEEIIEKSHRNKWDGTEGETLAGTLMDMKDKLVELSKKKNEISHFDHQAEALSAFSERLETLKEVCGDKEAQERLLVQTLQGAEEGCLAGQRRMEEAGRELREMGERILRMERETEQGKLALEEEYLQDLTLEKGETQTRLEASRKELEALKRELLCREAANCYLDYLENERQMNAQINAMRELAGSSGDLLLQLQAAANELELRTAKEIAGEQERLERLEQQLTQRKEARERQEERRQQALAEQAVSENRMQGMEEERTRLGRELERLRERTELSLLENGPGELARTQARLAALEKEESQGRERETELIDSLARMETRTAQGDQRYQELSAGRESCREQLDALREKTERRRKLEQVYAGTGASLLRKVEEVRRARIEHRIAMEHRLEETKRQLEMLEGGPSLHSDSGMGTSLEAALDYVVRHYDEKACLGDVFLASLEEEERERLWEQMPYLAGCIVMEQNLLEASCDELLAGRLSFRESVALVGAGDVRAGRALDGEGNVLLVSPLPPERMDEGLRQKKQFQLREEIGELEGRLTQIQESISVIEEDLFFLRQYFAQDEAEQETLRVRYEQLRTQSEQLLKELEEFAGRRGEGQGELDRIRERRKEIQTERRDVLQRQRDLEELVRLYGAYVSTERELGRRRDDSREAGGTLSRIQGDLEKLRRELREAQSQREICGKNLAELLERQKRLKPYLSPNETEASEKSDEELWQDFEGLSLAFEERNGDVSDKKRLVEIYRGMMQNRLEEIRYKGFTLEELERLAAERRISRSTLEELDAWKERASKGERTYENVSRELADVQSRLDRQEGILEQGKRQYEEKFGMAYVSPEERLPRESLRKLAREGADGLKALQEQQRELTRQARQQEKELSRLEALREELSHVMETNRIRPEAYGQLPPLQQELWEAYGQVRENYGRLSRQEQRCRQDFETDKAKLVETLRLLGAEDLAQEIGLRLANPSTVREIEDYVDGIGDVIRCIALEKERIEAGIQTMETMRDNFVTQCLQICVAIRESLERLPQLSTIRLDGKTTRMVQLSIPYLEEKDYRNAMEEYVEALVERADSVELAGERLRLIRSGLAWKRLFSVIVRDMDKIRLRLYKRERMKEQSRYLRYEEAVGSTGQSQGIYIQFLVAVINYISSMNSPQGQGELEQKTIFIDNPFGAAKDVYIWEPIFAMLKSNHVQLIVPSRGVTPAITSKFEVNYVLGQKLVDHRQQTVVVDYHSQVEQEELEYRRLEYVQESLDL